MSKRSVPTWGRYVPGVTGNPVGLAWRLLREPNPAARSALYLAIGGLLAAPLDRALARVDARLQSRQCQPAKPILLVCGPPRSGTTLVAHYLVDTLCTDYLSNLTSLFPRAPLAARKFVTPSLSHHVIDYAAFYGRSRGLHGINDALYLWDRWLGDDRQTVPDRLQDGSADSMPSFFAVLQEQSGLPTVNKVNRLVTCADLVANVLPDARFICLRRDPASLARSLLVARQTIVGDSTRSYGTLHPDPVRDDPIEDVCRQVEFYQSHTKRLQAELGRDRFHVMSYEDFCRHPRASREQALRTLQLDMSLRHAEAGPMQFTIATGTPLPASLQARLEKRLDSGPTGPSL